MKVLCGMVLVVLFAGPGAVGETYRVNPEGSGDFPNIQAAIDACGEGDMVFLAEGRFAGEGNRDIDFEGKAVTLQSESDDPLNCLIDCEGTVTDQHRGAVFRSGEGPETVLRGVTITNGYVFDFYHFPDGSGGGILIQDASPTIVNCRFVDNTSAGGGGVLCYWNANPHFAACVFVGNDGYLTGGGIYCYGEASPYVEDCTFTANRPMGLYAHGGSSPTLERCAFGEHDGAGIGLGSDGSNILECEFSANRGPALRGFGCSAVVERCRFVANEAANGAAIYCDLGFAPLVRGCLFWGNVAESRGGVAYAVRASTPRFVNCTMVGNSAPVGGAIDFEIGSADVENTIIAFNGGGAAVNGSVTLSCVDIYGNPGGDWVGSIAGQYGVDGNISEDPLFCDAEHFDFSLNVDSPCAPFSPPNPECDLIGSEPVACGGPTACENEHGRGTTWGAMKALFRGDAK